MVDMFEKKMCDCCKNNNCNHKIEIIKRNNLIIHKCYEYVKDESKIVPYQEPLIVTAERDYVTKIEN